jgi:hypothetical protein
MSEHDASAWWEGGLRFECTRCGLCCRGSGRVEVSDAEIERLARREGLDDEAFRRTYTREGRRGRIDLRDARNGDCIFFVEGRGCRVYEDRPSQCRTYPFWRSVLHDAESWRVEAGHCEGIERGERVPVDVIRALLGRRR